MKQPRLQKSHAFVPLSIATVNIGQKARCFGALPGLVESVTGEVFIIAPVGSSQHLKKKKNCFYMVATPPLF